MADNWESFTLSPPFVDEILAASNFVSDTLSALQEFLDIIKALLEIAKALSNLIATNPIEAILAALIAEIEAILDGLLQSTGVHGIFIPIQKQNVIGLGDVVQRATALVNPETDDENDRTTSFSNLVDDNAFPDTSTAAESVIAFIDNAPNTEGGNAGFWRTLYESTKDEGDPNRPRFTEDFAVAGTSIVFGSRDTLADLYAIIELFDSLLRFGNRADLSGKTKPTVQNLRGRALTISDEDPARIGVQLDWDKLGPAITFPAFTADQFIIAEYLVIRSTNPLFRQATTWSDVFPVQPDLNNINDLPSTFQTEVVARIPNDGFVVRYIDRDESLVAGQAYFYAIASIIEVDIGLAENITLPVSNLSNIVRVGVNRPVDSKGGEPPDWIATPSLASLFPALEALINEIKLAVASLLSRTATGPNLLDTIIAQIEALVNRSEQIIAILAEINARIAALLTSDVDGVFATVYAVESGGIDAWTSELARRLSDTTDTTRPMFDQGDELVAGVVIVGGAPNFAGLAPFLTLLELFFGSSDSGASNAAADAAGPANPLLEAVEQLDVLVGEGEKIVFGDDMSGDRVAVGTPEEEAPKITFDENLQPIDPANCN